MPRRPWQPEQTPRACEAFLPTNATVHIPMQFYPLHHLKEHSRSQEQPTFRFPEDQQKTTDARDGINHAQRACPSAYLYVPVPYMRSYAAYFKKRLKYIWCLRQ